MRCGAPVAVVLLVAACATEPATQIVVVVDSDLAVPGELDELRIRIFDAQGGVATDRVVRLGDGEGEFTLPTDFGVAPRDPEAAVQVTIELQARLLGATLFTTRAITGFREGHQLRLDMILPAACVGRPACDAAETCTASGCADAAIDPATLEEFAP